MSLPRVSLLLCVLALGACAKKRAPAKESEPVAEPTPVIASVERKPGRVPADLRWLAFGGGSDPLSNQVSLAQDLELASRSFAGRGMMLFASGARAPVAILRSEERASSVRLAVSRVLGPAGAEGIRYQPTTLAVDAPATRELVLDALRGALQTPGEPLLILAASHGERGEVARQSSLALWGGWGVSVEDVAELLDREESVRPTRLVVTACYGGGFAELAFVGADPQRGERAPTHCGLFAAPWDDESSGCDPDANRVRQESFTIHFLSALRGEDRNGRRAEIDLDHDGKVSLLEAHAWARIHARSFDVPTTTSGRYLREHAPTNGAGRALEPEEQSVITALSTELELDDERAARSKLRELERILDDAATLLDDAQAGSDDTYTALRIALLERWPLLDHSWDPEAEAVLDREATSILQLLTESELAQQHEAMQRELADAAATHDSVRIARARVQRLVHAFETTRLAGALERQGGAHWAHYRALRDCERFAPALR
ncbi:MAG TPA: hypothetical protein VFX59_00180 [Polyangiales bacterium]|nr:hypothetical protein [Polyangiales bacterium]